MLSLSGKMTDRPLARVLSDILALGRSGVLKISQGAKVRQFFIEKGWVIRYAASNLLPESVSEHLKHQGRFHSDQMRVVEKFTRTGNQMLYEVTIEDPEVFVKPWVMNPRTLRISNNPTIISEHGSCVDGEREQVSTQIRH